MPDSPDWYEVTRGSELLQGDLLHNCPIPRVRGLEHWPLRAGQPLEVDIDQEDVIILSQSCDLANDKIQDVVLAQVLDWAVACSLGHTVSGVSPALLSPAARWCGRGRCPRPPVGRGRGPRN